MFRKIKCYATSKFCIIIECSINRLCVVRVCICMNIRVWREMNEMGTAYLYIEKQMWRIWYGILIQDLSHDSIIVKKQNIKSFFFWPSVLDFYKLEKNAKDNFIILALLLFFSCHLKYYSCNSFPLQFKAFYSQFESSHCNS